MIYSIDHHYLYECFLAITTTITLCTIIVVDINASIAAFTKSAIVPTCSVAKNVVNLFLVNNTLFDDWQSLGTRRYGSCLPKWTLHSHHWLTYVPDVILSIGSEHKETIHQRHFSMHIPEPQTTFAKAIPIF